MKKQPLKIKYALADDHKIFRQGLRLILNQYKELEYIGEAENGEALLDLLQLHPVDIVLMDLSMPVLNGIETTKRIVTQYPQTRVLILSMHDEEAMITHAMQIGANGFILKNSEPSTIANAIQSIIQTGYYFNEVVNAQILKKLISEKNQVNTDNKLPELNDREIAIIRLICQEKTSAEIGEAIFLSSRTVEGIRLGIMEKIGVRNIAGIVAYAFRNGIV